MTDEDDIFAAEYALGLLEGVESEGAESRARHDPEFAKRVAWWREQLTPLANDMAPLPPTTLWARIEQALPQNDNSLALMQRWRAAALGAMTVAAALAGIIVLRPMPVVQSPQVMVAALKGTAGATATIAYEATTGQLTVVPGTFDTKGRDAELWIIPANGTPYSLGVIDSVHTSRPIVAANRRAFIQAGTSFAISLEPKGGSPTGLPTGPIIGAGKISGA
jgi:anti-sigma-K factor RskA